MAHECPDCGMLCYCNGDIDDMQWDANSQEAFNCKHWKICELEDDDFDPESD